MYGSTHTYVNSVPQNDIFEEYKYRSRMITLKTLYALVVFQEYQKQNIPEGLKDRSF